MTQQNEMSREQAIIEIALQLDGPISLREFVQRVLSIWSSNAKKPEAGVRQAIRSEHLGKSLVFLDDDTLAPTQTALAGVRFRVPLSREEFRGGFFFVYPALQYLAPNNFPIARMQLVDEADQTIPTETVSYQEERESILGSYTHKADAFNLGWWYKRHRVRRDDSLLLTILDRSAAKFRVQPETVQDRRDHRAEIEASNRKLADALFALLETSRYEQAWGWEAIPTAYARVKDSITYPTDHWLTVIENDPRMRWDGSSIRYAESQTLLERMIPELREQRPAAAAPKPSRQQLQQVYRFKASLKYRKDLWRRIEIRGGQTVAEFDTILRDAFLHDRMDHLGGFWQLISRGSSRRFREVQLATVYPYGKEGEGANTKIASIGLKPGDQLKYVYDFGDWIEHRLELEEIVASEAEADYPRVVAQNKPRYQYCPLCQEEGRKTIATYICIHCSNRLQEEVVVCEDHITPDHEDHHLEEMLY